MKMSLTQFYVKKTNINIGKFWYLFDFKLKFNLCIILRSDRSFLLEEIFVKNSLIFGFRVFFGKFRTIFL